MLIKCFCLLIFRIISNLVNIIYFLVCKNLKVENLKLKKMRDYFKLITVIIISSLIISCSNDKDESTSKKAVTDDNLIEIGVLEDGLPVIKGDKYALIKSWERNLLRLSRINAKFTDIYITEIGNEEYQLVFIGNEFKSSFFVQKSENDKLFVSGDTSCTTSDCSQEPRGCVVTYKLSKPGAPGSCTPCSNGGKCTKTTSNFSMISF